jgi:hypothetical protein
METLSSLGPTRTDMRADSPQRQFTGPSPQSTTLTAVEPTRLPGVCCFAPVLPRDALDDKIVVEQ